VKYLKKFLIETGFAVIEQSVIKNFIGCRGCHWSGIEAFHGAVVTLQL
jgi:hypothetical protein